MCVTGKTVGEFPADATLFGRETLRLPGPDGRERDLHLELAVPVAGFSEILRASYVPLAIAACANLVLLVLLLSALNSAYLRPVMRLWRATREVAEGEMEVDLDVQTGDELEDLAESFSDMLERLAEMQERALDANPLTGLPGNATIHRYVDAILERGEARAIVYGDLDWFKAYNDVYGFEAGDRVISFTAHLLEEVCRAHDGGAFIGHIGGDDFVLIMDAEHVKRAAEKIIERFDGQVGEFYSARDRERGYVLSKDRQGREQRFPPISISLGCLDTGRRKFSHFSEVAAAAAELKNQAKTKPGSAFVVDRRRA